MDCLAQEIWCTRRPTRSLKTDLRFALSVDPRILRRAKRRSVFRLANARSSKPGFPPILLVSLHVNFYLILCMLGRLHYWMLIGYR
jgi:hypothetical protein